MVVLLLAVSNHLDYIPTTATGDDGQKDVVGLSIPEPVKSFLVELESHDPPKHFKLTVSETTLAAATQNYKLGEQLVAMLLDHIQPQLKVTARSLIAAISSYNLFDEAFKPDALKSIVKRLVRAVGGCISVPTNVDLHKMSGDEYEDTVPEHKPLREVFLACYAGHAIKEDDVDDVFQYLEESQRAIGNEEVMVIQQV